MKTKSMPRTVSRLGAQARRRKRDRFTAASLADHVIARTPDVKNSMKLTVAALLLSTGLLGSACADGRGASGAHDLNRRATLVLVGAALAGAAARLLALGSPGGAARARV